MFTNETALNNLLKTTALLLKKIETIETLLQTYRPQIQEIYDTPLEDWVDGQYIMQILHLSPRTLQTLRTNRTLLSSRINNKLYYRRQDIRKILADNYTMFNLSNRHKPGKTD